MDRFIRPQAMTKTRSQHHRHGGDAAFPRTARDLVASVAATVAVAYVVAKHFEFTLTEQYEIIFGIFLGFRSLAQGMPSPQTTKE